jgi:hypothetical protein
MWMLWEVWIANDVKIVHLGSNIGEVRLMETRGIYHGEYLKAYQNNKKEHV